MCVATVATVAASVVRGVIVSAGATLHRSRTPAFSRSVKANCADETAERPPVRYTSQFCVWRVFLLIVLLTLTFDYHHHQLELRAALQVAMGARTVLLLAPVQSINMCQPLQVVMPALHPVRIAVRARCSRHLGSKRC
jgi:hypothetical protein